MRCRSAVGASTVRSACKSIYGVMAMKNSNEPDVAVFSRHRRGNVARFGGRCFFYGGYAARVLCRSGVFVSGGSEFSPCPRQLSRVRRVEASRTSVGR